MSVELGQPTIEIVTDVTQADVGVGLTETAITGFIDIEKVIIIGDRVVIIEKKLPFSYSIITGVLEG
ncbi:MULTISPECIES: hypothetical protein [Bacillaceae]|uniref:hypothetical protein n=1 Tax=Bacillaceae TaxID=186817 RepID=UPI001BDE5159|nr:MULTISPECIES: hypothetical protein [Bacillaceae]MDX8368012.1 hypothetical protein [Cytobacillus sp. IB215665]